MKKFIHSDYGASKGAALIIVLGSVLLATVLAPENVSAKASPTPTAAPTATATATTTPTPTPGPTATGTPVCYGIVSAQIANAGLKYVVGDTLDPVSGVLCNSLYLPLSACLMITSRRFLQKRPVGRCTVFGGDEHYFISPSSPSNPMKV